MNRSSIMALVKGVLAVLLVNALASFVYTRLDITEDKRYTLSDEAVATVEKFTYPVIIDVLLDGQLPSEFARLKVETRLLLEQFAAKSENIKFDFVNPLEEGQSREETIIELQQIGLTPANVTVEEEGKVSQELVFPWAIVNYNNKTVKVPLLKNKLGSTAEERINNSVQQLEYAFADAFTKLAITEKRRIAVIKGNGEMDDIYLADYLTTLKDYYNIGAITLDSVATAPQKVLDQLKGFDVALIAKPTEPFSDEEKYVLDQFIVHGGKSIWLIDQVAMELDSLFNEEGSAIAIPRDLNLDDFFFKYGVRINPVLVNDLYNTPIVLASGEANDSQYNPLPWVYHPMVFSKNNHPINNNIEALRLQFASVLDTLPNGNKKTVILQSSPLSKTDGIPKQISLSMLRRQPDRSVYAEKGNLALGVLIEGDFNSAFTNRIKPLKLKGVSETGSANKMLVIADGDVVKNQLRNGRPLSLGYDKWTSNTYGNKELMVNSMNYLLDETGLINIRNKKVAIPLLDAKKISTSKNKWQLINIGLPTILVLLLAFTFHYLRKKEFSV
ncbi:gliding motility-associated ABC transporter substrate-binding protein GldG [Croceitalea sp. MTPC5]|uniref:gliding motility-associated ABC transporter substrate-binding protein GldG n=1 Tax=Croceitalea sp. MTPC5 TaxID=3056565 RepID=UPI002B379223|nr:gliding motility-associated ABC transporter substrate-binding protein GldG [Croceitalea sp. MTPC5]